MRIRVAWFPKAVDLVGNPYWYRLWDALEQMGVVFETTNNSYWTQRRWLIANRGNVKVLHFHFIQPQYAQSEERVSVRRLLKFASNLLIAKALGYRIVWTLHDLMPTWPKKPHWVDRAARHTMAWLASDVIVHCAEARRLLSNKFWRSHRVWIIPHPGYADCYPSTTSTAMARRHLDIPQKSFVAAFVGGIRPNKGIELLLAAFERMSKPDAMLLIAGKPWPPKQYLESLKRKVRGNPRIRLEAKAIPDDELQFYLKAADVLVFPFRSVLTSGSVILAMSFARPVIVPRLGCLPELVQPNAGFIYQAGDVIDLTTVMCEAAEANLRAMGMAAALQVNDFTWQHLAISTLQVYGLHKTSTSHNFDSR